MLPTREEEHTECQGELFLKYRVVDGETLEPSSTFLYLPLPSSTLVYPRLPSSTIVYPLLLTLVSSGEPLPLSYLGEEFSISVIRSFLAR